VLEVHQLADGLLVDPVPVNVLAVRALLREEISPPT